MNHPYYKWRHPIEFQILKGEGGRHLIVSLFNPIVNCQPDNREDSLSGFLLMLED